MEQTEELKKRGEALKARIEAASKQLAADQKMESSEIGNILESFSREIEASHETPHPERSKLLDRLETEMETILGRLTGGPSA